MVYQDHTRFAATIAHRESEDEIEMLRAALAESDRALQSVLRSLSGLFYRCELQSPWKMRFVSAGVQELTGYSPSELEKREGWASLIWLEDQARVEASVAEAISQHCSFDITYRIIEKSGNVRWVSERGYPIYHERHRPLFLEGVIRDVSGRKEADELQKTMLTRWQKTLDTIPQMVWAVAADQSDEFFNAQWENFTGVAVRSVSDLGLLELVHPEDSAPAAATWKQQFSSADTYESQYRLKHRSGEYRWVLSRGQLERDANDSPVRWYGTCTDIHEQVLAREALQTNEAVTRSMVEASPDSVALLTTDGTVRFLNAAAIAALSATTDHSWLGRPWIEAFTPSVRRSALKALSQAQGGRTGRFTAVQPGADGSTWWDVVVAPIATGLDRCSAILSIARDITHQKTSEERIRWAANHDGLTRLPNRSFFQRSLDRALKEARDSGGAVTVLMMDLDDFKRTNDALGHDAGDALLAEFSSRVRAAVRADDVVARFGGDEFAVLLQGVRRRKDIEAAVASITEALRDPCHFDGKLIDIRTSIGASSYPAHGLTRGELLKNADIALLVAKGAGRGVLRIFEPQMRAEAQNRLSMLSLAKDALSGDRIRPFYQPKVNLRTGRLDGFEALLRWDHPIKGIQTPDTIAAAFQDMALASEISDRMIAAVIADMRRWSDEGVLFGHVAVNAAAAEFRGGGFAEMLLERLDRANLPTAALQVEVTETVFLGRGAEYVQEAVKALAAEGVKIALDDFGTGYASLSHLNHFPVSAIKVDRSFISRLEVSEHDAAIVRAVINLGRSLGIKIVAEGVETDRQAEFLKKHRCHSGQGYLYSKAVAPELVPALVEKFSSGARLDSRCGVGAAFVSSHREAGVNGTDCRPLSGLH